MEFDRDQSGASRHGVVQSRVNLHTAPKSHISHHIQAILQEIRYLF